MAGVRIQALPSALTVLATDVVPFDPGPPGGITKKATIAQIAAVAGPFFLRRSIAALEASPVFIEPPTLADDWVIDVKVRLDIPWDQATAFTLGTDLQPSLFFSAGEVDLQGTAGDETESPIVTILGVDQIKAFFTPVAGAPTVGGLQVIVTISRIPA